MRVGKSTCFNLSILEFKGNKLEGEKNAKEVLI